MIKFEGGKENLKEVILEGHSLILHRSRRKNTLTWEINTECLSFENKDGFSWNNIYNIEKIKDTNEAIEQIKIKAENVIEWI